MKLAIAYLKRRTVRLHDLITHHGPGYNEDEVNAWRIELREFEAAIDKLKPNKDVPRTIVVPRTLYATISIEGKKKATFNFKELHSKDRH